MEEQFAVIARIHAAALIEIVHMALKHFALEKVRAQILDDVPFLLGQLVAVRTVVNGREICALELNAPPVSKRDIGRAKVNLIEEQTILHAEIRIAADERTFELEHHHRYGALRRLDRVFVRIDARGKCRERTQADAVAAFEDVGIAVAERVADHARDANLAAERRAHP